jgi:hypothetical protein
VATEDDVRRLALALPGVAEKPSYGTPGFRVGDRLFARIHQDGGVLVLWTADMVDKESFIDSEPGVFFTTPHYDGYPHVLVRLDRVDAARLADLLEMAWRVRAPARLRARREGRTP